MSPINLNKMKHILALSALALPIGAFVPRFKLAALPTRRTAALFAEKEKISVAILGASGYTVSALFSPLSYLYI
jgi:hypothetical protein